MANSRTSLPELESRVLAHIDETALLEFHRKLVRIDTVNPPGDTVAAADLVAAPLEAAGFTIKRIADDVEPSMVSIVATTGDPAGKRLLLNAHYDVVPTGDRANWTHDPFGADVDDGKVYGRGAGDDKASVAAQVFAALALKAADIPLIGQLIITEVADEELGGAHGAVLVADMGYDPDWVIVGEQTNGQVCVGEKGSAAMRLTTTGRTAHGALPWEGVNAIEAMAEIIVALRRELYPRIAGRTHWAFKPSSITVNTIEGGVAHNVVPDSCSISIDRRILPGEEPDACLVEVDEIAQRTVAAFPGATVTVEYEFGTGVKGSESPVESPLVQAMISANHRLGFSEEPTGFSMATDGRHFAERGYETIIYGPGDPGLAHKPNEWVGVDEMVNACKAYAIAIVQLLGDYAEREQ